jgi:membrane-bound metal-dependent hydrolase YbcI (DUF457 family)
MPVIGHAFVGLATARELGPPPGSSRRAALSAVLWMPMVMTFAYLPDIVTQLGSMAGWPTSNLAGHSAPIGVALGITIGMIWARMADGPAPLVVAVAVGSILTHDLLDVMQATDRAPFWPFSQRIVSMGWLTLPRGSLSELLLFGLLFAAYSLWRGRSPRSNAAAAAKAPALVWAGRAFVTALAVAAVGTHTVRGYRERQLGAAERLLRRGQYADALQAADKASAWPSTAHPGRIDVIRGEAFEALGDSTRAERFYRRAYEADPTNFWALADLAEYYASRARPASERRAITQPYVDELRRDFSDHRALAEVLGRVDRKLQGE